MPRARPEAHRRRDEFIEDGVARIPSEPQTLAQVAAHVGLTNAADNAVAAVSMRDARRLGAALSNAGWSKRRVRRDSKLVMLWEPPA